MLAGIRNTIAGVFGRAPHTQDTHTRPDPAPDPEAGGGLTTASGIQIGFDDGDTATPVDEGGGATEASEGGGAPTTASGIQIGFDDGDTATPVDEGGGATEASEGGGAPTTASGIQIGFDDGDGDAATPIGDAGESDRVPEVGGTGDGGFGVGHIRERPATVAEDRSDIDAFGSGELTRPTEHSEAAAVLDSAPPEVEVPPLDASPLDTLAPIDVDAYPPSGDDESPPVEELTSTEDPDAGGEIA